MRVTFGRAGIWAGMIGVVVGLHAVGWGLMLGVVAPAGLAASGQAFGLGVGATAYLLGVRHAFDADHIAAIDNTTRKLVQDGVRRPVSVGLWFSLGHSSVVFGMAVLLALGIRAVVGQVRDDSSTLHLVTGWVGTTVSGLFLLLIAVINLVTLVGLVRAMIGARRHGYGAEQEERIERLLGERGLVARALRPVVRRIDRPWKMYPTGLLFGLGFDTATEITLLVLAGGATAAGLPWYAVLCLPVLFAAGMSLFDTADGVVMARAYGWSMARPARKLYYNVVVTALSVLVAFGIGGVELLGLLVDRLGWHGPLWDGIAAIDLNDAGFVVAGALVGTWLIALALWKGLHLERRLAPAPDTVRGR